MSKHCIEGDPHLVAVPFQRQLEVGIGIPYCHEQAKSLD
jgi:hypothetical protein